MPESVSSFGKVEAAKSDATALPQSPASVAQPAAPNAEENASPPAGLPPELAHHPKYCILRELGRGGMGVVYQARQTVMNRQVVIKVITPSLLANPDALERFHREVQAAASLSHPNIVTAYDAEQAGDLHLLVMEFVPGQSLAEIVHQKGPLPVANACHYVRQAALGLQHAFEQGMVHRDIKPHNLMLTPKGQVKVLDFGLARLRGGGQRVAGLTDTGAFMGTPEYVAPEQATDARTADIRADLYGLGCTLYFLLTGHPPFIEDTAVKLVLAHIEKEPAPLHDLRADVPQGLSAVVGRLLAKDPAHRYQTPVELAQALVPFIKAGARGTPAPVASQPPGVVSPHRLTKVDADTGRLEKLDRSASRKKPTAPADAGERRESLTALPHREQFVGPTRRGHVGSWVGKWWVIGAPVAAMLVGLIGVWAAGVFKGKTNELALAGPEHPAVSSSKPVHSDDTNGTETPPHSPALAVRHQPPSKPATGDDDSGITGSGDVPPDGGATAQDHGIQSPKLPHSPRTPAGKPGSTPDDDADLQDASARLRRETEALEAGGISQQGDVKAEKRGPTPTPRRKKKSKHPAGPPKLSPQEQEVAAEKEYEFARTLYKQSIGEDGRVPPRIIDRVQARLEKIIKDFPHTKAAKDAQKELERIFP